MTTRAVERLRALHAEGEARSLPAHVDRTWGRVLPDPLRPLHLPTHDEFASVLRAATDHLAALANAIESGSPWLRGQILAIAAQAGGVERLARQFLDSLTQGPV